jgi:hypothetical protein
MRITIGCALLVAATTCGGGPASPGTPAVLRVAGQYQITQQAVSDTCGQTGTPQAVTGTVTHEPGAGAFTLRDTGGTSFTGTVQSNGDFTATATFGPDAAGDTFTQRLAGRFTTAGFAGQLDVDVTPRACRFTRNWTATKQGSPNIIP